MSTEPPVWFAVPPAFVDLDLGDDARTRAGTLVERAALDADRMLRLLLAQELLVESLRRSHVRYAAHCLTLVDGEERLSLAQFLVAVQSVAVGTPTLEAMAGQLESHGLCRDVGMLDLPAGRALAVVEDRTFTTSESVLGTPRRRVHRVRQAQLVLPFPDRAHLAVFVLATECGQDWAAYSDLFGAIARSVSFSRPREVGDGEAGRSSIAQALEGGTGGR